MRTLRIRRIKWCPWGVLVLPSQFGSRRDSIFSARVDDAIDNKYVPVAFMRIELRRNHTNK